MAGLGVRSSINFSKLTHTNRVEWAAFLRGIGQNVTTTDATHKIPSTLETMTYSDDDSDSGFNGD